MAARQPCRSTPRPNGAAIGPDGKVYICNNGGFRWHQHPQAGLIPTGQPDDYSGGRIERLDLTTGRIETLYTECNGTPLKSPNDLVSDTHGGFYFTDLGKSRPREIDRGAVYHAKADGSFIEAVAYPPSPPTAAASRRTARRCISPRPSRRGSGPWTS